MGYQDLKNKKVGDKLYTLNNGNVTIIRKSLALEVRDDAWNTYIVHFDGKFTNFNKPWKPPFCFADEQTCEKYFTEIERAEPAPIVKMSFEHKLRNELQALKKRTSYEKISDMTNFPRSSVYKMMGSGMILRVGFVVALENAGLIDMNIAK